MVKIRLYIEQKDEAPGLYYGKNRVRVCDDIWQVNIMSSDRNRPRDTIWKFVYKYDLAHVNNSWYALEINRFVVLT